MDMERLKARVKQEVRSLRKAEEERKTLGATLMNLGTLGLQVVIPVVGGAYLGWWLDKRHGTYLWTGLLIFVGLAIGAINTYLNLRD